MDLIDKLLLIEDVVVDYARGQRKGLTYEETERLAKEGIEQVISREERVAHMNLDNLVEFIYHNAPLNLTRSEIGEIFELIDDYIGDQCIEWEE